MIFGRTKGSIAELLAQEYLRETYRPRELPIELVDRFKIKVPDHIKRFIRDNWFSIDLFGFEVENYVVQNLILYEVKGRNHYADPSKLWKPKLTSNCYTMYKHAQAAGYKVIYVDVVFYYNWDYDVKHCPLDLRTFCIDDGNVGFRKRDPQSIPSPIPASPLEPQA